ncbi:MAG TPA: hypothetical protein EYP98_08115 [Planctomycetes bacterium]|nr:hypothetical protein [Planctomycetota bacterium]
MAIGDENTPGKSRAPVLADVVDLCRRLNEQQARYLVIGGWAIIQLGFGRTTEDLDLLVEDSTDNFERIQKAMLGLPDGAVREMEATDLSQYTVVRVGAIPTTGSMFMVSMSACPPRQRLHVWVAHDVAHLPDRRRVLPADSDAVGAVYGHVPCAWAARLLSSGQRHLYRKHERNRHRQDARHRKGQGLA